MVCIFSLYYKTLKKGRGEIKRERKKEKRVREQPPPLLLYVDFPWHCYVLCVCTWLGFMYKQEHQQSDNKFFRGLWTPNSFLHGSHGRRSPCRFYCYSQLMLNNRQLLTLNVASVWLDECADCNANYKVCTCGYIRLRLAVTEPAEPVKCMNP